MSLQPTDRVLAKLIIRAWLTSEQAAETNPYQFVNKFVAGTIDIVKANNQLMLPLVQLLKETVGEMLAEELGNASLNIKEPFPQHTPQPWAEDAGSGC